MSSTRFNLKERSGDEWERFEEGKIVAYLDNATITNACALIAEPRVFNAYRLLDLESLCEAILLFDCVRTLIGHSYCAALRSGVAEYVPGVSLYKELIQRDLLHPVTLHAGTVDYVIEGLPLLDDIARQLDISEAVLMVEQVFGESIPWTYKQPESGTFSVLWGVPAFNSDSYPVFYFSKPASERKPTSIYEPGTELANRRTGWKETLVSQTLLYIAQASFHKVPYICSSVRVPIVEEVLRQLNRRFFSTIHACLAVAVEPVREKVNSVVAFFGEGAVDFPALPALFCVLRSVKHRQDVIPGLLELRDRPDIVEFRSWSRALHRALRDNDLSAILSSLRELRNLSTAISESFGATPLHGAALHVPELASLSSHSGSTRERQIAAAAYSPGLAFLKDVGGYLEACKHNAAAIGSVLDHKITAEDVALIESLQGRRKQLFSRGTLPLEKRSVSVERMEIRMGDTFENVHHSVIATRGSIAKNLGSLEVQGKDDLAAAIRRIDALLSSSRNDEIPPGKKAEGMELLNGISKECSQQQPNATVLKSLGTSLQQVVGAVKPVAEAVKACLDLFPH